MKKLILLMQLSMLVLFYNCDSTDPDGNGDPTTFNGTVIFKDIQEDVSAEVVISGFKDDTPGDQVIVFENQILQQDGSFAVSFEGNKEIDFFVLDVLEKQEVAGPALFNSTDCGNLNCAKILPGNKYDDLVITVELK